MTADPLSRRSFLDNASRLWYNPPWEWNTNDSVHDRRFVRHAAGELESTGLPLSVGRGIQLYTI